MYDYGYYDYGYDYGNVGTGLAVFGAGMLVVWLIAMAVSVFTIICNWIVFKKAGKPGWASIIPIYNTIVMIQIAELPMWYIALFFVPFANIYAIFKINIEIAKKFGKSAGFGVGMTFLPVIFYAILAFSKTAVYDNNMNNVQQNYQQPVQPQVTPVMPMPEAAPVQPQVTPVMPMPEAAPVQPQVTPVMPMPEAIPVQPQVTPVMPMPEAAPVQPQVNNVNPTFCTNCGNALIPNTKFCTNCGKQI